MSWVSRIPRHFSNIHSILNATRPLHEWWSSSSTQWPHSLPALSVSFPLYPNHVSAWLSISCETASAFLSPPGLLIPFLQAVESKSFQPVPTPGSGSQQSLGWRATWVSAKAESEILELWGGFRSHRVVQAKLEEKGAALMWSSESRH